MRAEPPPRKPDSDAAAVTRIARAALAFVGKAAGPVVILVAVVGGMAVIYALARWRP